MSAAGPRQHVALGTPQGHRCLRAGRATGRRPVASLGAALPAAFNLNHAGHYLHWGVVQISVSNLIVIVAMLAVFALALLLPFPGHRRRP
jgi:hypothetical protein